MHAVSFAAQCLHFAYDVSKYAQLLLSDSVFPLPVAVVDSLCDQFIPASWCLPVLVHQSAVKNVSSILPYL